MTTIIEQAITQPRGEDGRFASPTPPPDASTAPAATDAPELAAPAPADERAPVTAGNEAPADVDPYARARQVLADKAKPQTPPAVGDRTTDAPAAAATPTGQHKADGDTTPQPSPKEYNGTLSANEFALLKSVPGMLPDPKTWGEMGISERLDHLNDVRAIRNERNARFQQQQAAAGRAAPAQPNHSQQADPHDGRGAGVSGQVPQPPQAGQPAAVAGTESFPDDVRQALALVAEEWGADSAVYRSQLAIARRNVDLEQQLRSQDEQRQFAAAAAEQERVNRSIEDQHFEAIADRYPQLKDAATRDKLRDDIRDYHAMRHRQGRPVSPEEAVRFVTHNTLYPEIERQQQAKAQADRKRTLDQTFDRGGPAPTPASQPAREQQDVYARARERVNRAARDGQAGRAHALAG
ncbi:MAG TPA: hypothetical protein VEA69_16730 [Tepidisphaeraceae bacterium]|nr:hypothetical protein [Tepidisphaeraceae bacterium]